MRDFEGRLAVVTGGGSGMGRELVRQLAAAGAHVAMCDLSAEAMAETAALAGTGNHVRITSHVCDVGHEPDVMRFRDEVLARHQVDHAHLLINNAGIGGGGSFVAGDRSEWERTFAVCWYGVYYGCRAFLPLLVKAPEGHVVNVSSINGTWGSIGPRTPHTSYVAAKFAVKGFTEALMTDLRVNAPHVKASVVMPGHVGTRITQNTGRILGKKGALDFDAADVAKARRFLAAKNVQTDGLTDDEVRRLLIKRLEAFRDRAPTSAAEAATIILDGVRRGAWRILVGEDAEAIDAAVREKPEEAYEPEFLDRLVAQGHFRALLDIV
jgi:NAD(P)-dependent dehydrogenase (short-subunit alcohol dehydrogenase family)